MDDASLRSAVSIPLLLSIGSLSILLWKYILTPCTSLPFPPGPKPLPFIGNLLDIPTEKEWITYHRWAQVYGEIASVQSLGLRIVILDSARAAVDLLERRAAIYSDRKVRVMLNELMGFDWTFAMNAYGDKWRRGRRAFHGQLHQGVARNYEGVQMREARIFQQQLLDNPEDLPGLIRGMVGATVMNIVYNIEVKKKNDPYVTLAEEVNHYFSLGVMPGSFMVDYIPALRYVPAWFPGAGFQKIAEKARRTSLKMREEPVNVVKRAIADGTARPCVVSRMLGKLPPDSNDPEQEQLIRDTAGIAYQGGADTMSSSLPTFFLAMILHPAVVEKAQRELDAVVGTDRLPDFTDRPRLPYVNAIISEVLRWQPVTPLGVPHAVIADDEYKGYSIPKGTMVLANIWAMTRNPADYPEPEEFRPERFLTMQDGAYVRNKAVRNPATVVFGFGRRNCPGRHVADQTLYAVIALVLATYDITPALDGDGKPAYPEVKMLSGLASHPAPFKCTIKPRSARAAELINGPLPDRGL